MAAPTSTSKKFWSVLAGVATVVLIILIIIFSKKCNNDQDNQISAQIAAVKSAYADSVNNAFQKGRTNGLGAGFANGQIAASKKYADSLAAARAALDDCNKAKHPAKKIVAKKASTPLAQKKITTATGQFAPPAAALQKQVAANSSYVPIVAPQITPSATPNPSNRDTYITVSDGKICYVFNKSVVSQMPNDGRIYRLKGINGLPFVLGSDGWYRCISDEVATNSSYQQTFRWNVYAGNDPTYGFPVFFPHEAIKPYLRQARGSEAGIITSEDLVEIAKICTEVKNGEVSPNGVYVTGSYDHLQYGGWDYVSNLYK